MLYKYGSEVRRWLEHWRHAKVPLKEARRKWLTRQVDSCCSISNALHTHDCHALCAYRLSGQLLNASTGSITMFVLLDDVDPDPTRWSDYACEENFLNTMTPEALIAEYVRMNACGGDGGQEQKVSLVDAGIELARRRVRTLQRAVSNRTLALEVRHSSTLLRLPVQENLYFQR